MTQEQVSSEEQVQEQPKRAHTFKGMVFHNKARLTLVKEHGNYFGKWVVARLEDEGKVFRYMHRYMGMKYPDRLLTQLCTKESHINITLNELFRMAEYLEVSYTELMGHFFIEQPTIEQRDIQLAGLLLKEYYQCNRKDRDTILTMAHKMAKPPLQTQTQTQKNSVKQPQ